ncbi:hypothetical protein HY416_02360 [Candidatus Kaiserbacteria bacterium]|nr:hypothetical protein [Candidatus Kaiserbacteria bacterium]
MITSLLQTALTLLLLVQSNQHIDRSLREQAIIVSTQAIDAAVRQGGGVVSTSYQSLVDEARQKARDARRISEIHQLRVALELYYDVHGGYPHLLSELDGYISVVPTDPLTGVSYAYVTLPKGCTSRCTGYHIGALLETNHRVLMSDADRDSTPGKGGFNGVDSKGCNGKRGYCFDIYSEPSATLTVLSPGEGDYSDSLPLDISWTSYEGGDFDYYYVMLGNTLSGSEVTLTPDTRVSQKVTSLRVDDIAGTVREMIANSGGLTADEMEDAYYVAVLAVSDDRVGGSTVARAASAQFSIR